jgi:hypothetical protein
MQAVLISIQPKWCELIASGKKTVEVRKTAPKLEPPFKCYIYCTKPKHKKDWGLCKDGDGVSLIARCNYPYAQKNNLPILSGKVIGEFVCDDCSLLTKAHYGYIEQYGCIPREDLRKYMGIGERRELSHSDGCCGWHISDLVIYDTPKELGEFVLANTQHYCHLQRPPQSWCYVEV